MGNHRYKSRRASVLKHPPGLAAYGHKDVRGQRSRVLPGVNLSALAVALNIDRAYLTHILNGSHSPGKKLLFRMAAVLGATVEEVDAWLESLRRRVRKVKDDEEEVQEDRDIA